MMVAGVLQIWIAGRIPASTAALIASDSTPALWMNSLLLFGQTALKAMGYWSLIEATGLLYGIRLRKNFLRLLTLRDPSELWRSWRASLTNWLIVYVYAPLGANRRHQSWNIAAAFFVSWLWHALGVPFMTADFGLADLAPVTTWAMLSALAVIGHVQAQNRHITFLPIRPPAAVNRVLKTALTVALASFTVTMLSYQGAASDHFPGYLRMLLAIGE
jgi:D-alanyl-lipoteichoic acid acyltransferase DltB (MBOAT superfamily)